VTKKISFNLRCIDAWKLVNSWRTYVLIKYTRSMINLILMKNTVKREKKRLNDEDFNNE